MDISRFRKSSGGLFTRRSGQVEITPGTNEPSAQSLARSLTDGSLRNSPPQEQEDKLFVAVGKEFMESRSVLMWALRNSPRSKKFVLVHVHRPAKMIPMSKCFCSLLLTRCNTFVGFARSSGLVICAARSIHLFFFFGSGRHVPNKHGIGGAS